MQLTNAQKLEEYHKLNARINLLRRNGASEKLVEVMGYYNSPDNFGYEQGQLREGELGQWDLYFALYQDFGHSKVEAAMGAGLTLEQIQQEERNQDILDSGFDPDNEWDVREYEILENATPEQLDMMIEKLENLLKD